MKNKILWPLIILLIIGGFIFLHASGTIKIPGLEKLLPISVKENSLSKKNLLEKDDFSVVLPNGWKEISAPTGVSALVINDQEEMTDPAVKRINFKSYFAIKYDVLGERTKEDYINAIKETVQIVATGIKFIQETSAKVNGQEAYLIEGEVSQQGVDFKVLLVIIEGKDKGMWVISLNATKSNWDNYKNLFNQIINSFKLK